MLRKVVEWVALLGTAALVIYTIWFIGTVGSVDILVNHFGNWGIVLALIPFVFAYFIAKAENN